MIQNEFTLEQRVQIIEKELNEMKIRFEKKSKTPWWRDISGMFENDPIFNEIDFCGKVIREQERTSAAK